MIKANELRIGNWVKNLHERGRIKQVTQLIDWDYEGLEPIPLTHELLEKCGFKEIDPKVYIKGKFTINLSTSQCWLDSEDPFSFHETDAKITHLHQLQNLCFALTGNELEVTL